MFLWLLLASFSIIFILVYFVIYSSLLHPIATLSNNLKLKDVNDGSPFQTIYKSAEMQDFVHALNDMQHQINVRQNQLEHMAMHDALTRLPNRSLLLDRINSAISTYHRYKENFAVILLDLDRFKEVNDTLGHLVGDEILIEVADRLKSLLRESDTVARLGGDEFAILLQKVNMTSIEEMAKKISDVLADVYKINEHNLYLGASLGVAIYPQHGKDPDSLMQHADVAMYLAKNNNSDYEIYHPEKDTFNVKQLALLSDLRDAINNQELYLEYQPIYNTEGSHINSFECLIRWKHSEFGIILPDKFIFHAEQTGLIRKITQWVISEVCENLNVLKKYDNNIHLSINVTAWDLQDESLVNYIDNCIQQNSLDFSSIVFELTERSMMNDSLRVRSVLNRLSKKGLRFSVDDFGTGFSSLIYLTQLPISMLKIDKSFVQSMNNNPNDAMIVHSIVDLAHNLELQVIAEGVEDKQTLTAIKELNCDMVQGFVYGKPMTFDKVLKLYPQPDNKPDIKLVT
jgi:diguanylate cyclase (GGDEF)-like protein